MRIISFIQDEHSIKEFMKSKGIPEFQASPPIPKFIDAVEAIDELPEYDLFEPVLDDFQIRFLPNGTGRVYAKCYC